MAKDILPDQIDQPLCRSTDVGAEQRLQPFFPVFFTSEIHRLADAVSEQYKRVSLRKADTVLAVRSC